MASVATIRDALPVIGRTILGITQDDFEGPIPPDQLTSVYLHLDDGSTITMQVSQEVGFSYDGYPDGHPFEAGDDGDDDE